MRRLLRVIDAVDDRLNPIVVKELRQAVQSRFVIVMLLGFLLVDVIVVMFGVIGQDVHGGSRAGREIFMVLQAILLAACIGFLPIYSALRMAAEHGDGNTDLLFITTIRPGAVIRGKFAAGMTLALTVYGACMPFMTFTYLLRGIDLPTIFFLLGLNLLATAEAVMFALLLAAMPVGRVVRSFLGLVLLGCLFTGYCFMIYCSERMVSRGLARSLSDPDFWPSAATVVGVSVAALGLMYVTAVALLSPRSSNRGMAIRIYMVGVWAAGLAVAIAWSGAAGASDGPVEAWVYVCSVVLCGSFFVAVSEREEIGPRVRQSIPSWPPLRVLAFPFFAGAAGGVVWCLLLVLGTFVAAWTVQACMPTPAALLPIHHDIDKALGASFCLLLFCYCYAMTGALLRRLLFPLAKCEFNGVAGLVTMALGCLLPWVLGFFLGADTRGSEELWFITNPLAAMVARHGHDATPAFALGVVWAIAISLASLPWLVKQTDQFTPLTRSPAAEEEVVAADA